VAPLLVPALALGAGSAWLGIGLVQALAFGGGVLTVLAVVGLARGSSPVVGLLLTGYAVSSLLSAVVALLLFGAGRALGAVVAWLLGSLAGAGWSDLAVAGPLLGLSFIGLLLHWRSLNLLLMGDEAATHLGLDVRRTRLRLVLLASLSASAAVAVSGTIGFVGLVVPHLVRLLSGPDHRLLLPLSALLGGALLMVADLGVRLAGGVPVGVATALIGAPFLLWLLSRSRRTGGAAWPSA
jgi:iron complex transport system permease protein